MAIALLFNFASFIGFEATTIYSEEALASPDVARMLCEEIGWTESQHARWLADTLIRTLLPDD